MKFVRILIVIFLFLSTVGCASMQQLQGAMYDINSFWGTTNTKYVDKYGSKQYDIPKEDCEEILLDVFADLGMVNTATYSNSVPVRHVFRSPAPGILTEAEFDEVKRVEEPMMQAIAAKKVGDFTSGMFYLTTDDFEIIIYAEVGNGSENLQLDDNTSKVSLDFKMEYMKPDKYNLYGDQPPPEAVKLSLQKIWEILDGRVKQI